MSEHLLTQAIKWIDSNAALEQYCEQWHSQRLIALDTEFMRSKTYYPIAGLLQFNDGHANYLLDPLAVSDYAPLAELFDQDDIVFALHSASEDLEVLNQQVGHLPQTICDTQIACALDGPDFSMGYARAVQDKLDVDLPKSETRSDWLQRPLSKSQIMYAALDVEYLFQLATTLIESLSAKNRLDYVFEEGQGLLQAYKVIQDPELSYKRVRGAWKLNARQLYCLQSLSRWRELAAQARDVPRNQIIKENVLLELAKRMPESKRELGKISDLSEKASRRYGDRIIELVQAARELEASALPEPLPMPLSKAATQILKDLRARIEEVAEQVNIASEILLKKKDYEALVRQFLEAGKVESLSGWRGQLLNEHIAEFFKHAEANS